MNKIHRIQNQGIASTEARRQGALRLLRFAAALAGDSTPLLRLKRLGMAERFLSARTRPETTTPLFPRKQPFFGSARSGPGRGTRRSEPLTARTDLESSKAREKGILAHHAILGELRGERSEAAKREAPPLRMSVRGRKPT